MHSEAHSNSEPRRDASLESLRGLLKERATSFVATLVLLGGTAEIVDPATGRTRPAEGGIRIARQTTLRVRTGRALVRMDDGSDVWLAAGAELDFSPWTTGARKLRLAVGKALALVAHEAKRAFEMYSPAGSILVTGTAFEAVASPNDLAVSVLHGSVVISTDSGKVRAKRGDAAHARPNMPPVLSRAIAGAGSWIEDAAASASNAKVTPAFRALEQTLPTRGTHPKENASMKNNRSALVVAAIVVVLIAGAIGVAVVASNSNASTTTAAAPKDKLVAGAPNFKTEHKGKIRLKMDGKDVEFEVGPNTTDAELDAMLAQVPEDKRDHLRGMLDNLRKSDGKTFNFQTSGGPGPGDSVFKGGEGTVSREATASADAMKALIAQGMSKEEASKIVSQALADSLQKQINDPNAKVKAIISDGSNSNIVGPDGKPIVAPEGATVMMLGIESTSDKGGNNDIEVNVGGK